MKAKKIASLACAFLLACSAVCPITGHAQEIEIDGVNYCWNGSTLRPIDMPTIDNVVLESKEDIVIDDIAYSFKGEAWNKYIYEGVANGVTYVTCVEGECDENCTINYSGKILCTKIPKDITIDGIAYSFYSCPGGFDTLSSNICYRGTVDGIPHVIDVDLESGEILSDMMCPETFVEESTGLTYSLAETDIYGWGTYESVGGEITYIREMLSQHFDFRDEIVDITVNGATYSIPFELSDARVNGLYYRHGIARFIYDDGSREDDLLHYYNVYEMPYSIHPNSNFKDVDPASILSEIDGIPVFSDGELEWEYINTFFDECRESCFAEMGNSDIMTLEDEIEIPAVKGDATGDGEVDILDVIVANKAILGQKTLTPEQTQALDIDGNGIVDTTDSLAIMKYITGLMETL